MMRGQHYLDCVYICVCGHQRTHLHSHSVAAVCVFVLPLMSEHVSVLTGAHLSLCTANVLTCVINQWRGCVCVCVRRCVVFIILAFG